MCVHVHINLIKKCVQTSPPHVLHRLSLGRRANPSGWQTWRCAFLRGSCSSPLGEPHTHTCTPSPTHSLHPHNPHTPTPTHMHYCSDHEVQFYEMVNFEPYCQLRRLESVPLKLDFWLVTASQVNTLSVVYCHADFISMSACLSVCVPPSFPLQEWPGGS